MSIRKQLDEIEELRIAYRDGRRGKLMRKQIKSWNTLLKGDPSGRSSGRKSVFKRAHKFAAVIQHKLGSEVLLLVLSSLNRTQMAEHDKKLQLLEELRKWWGGVQHPLALKETAMCLPMAKLEEVDDEADDEEVDTNTSKIMEHGKST
jgi:hypothetical protein